LKEKGCEANKANKVNKVNKINKNSWVKLCELCGAKNSGGPMSLSPMHGTAFPVIFRPFGLGLVTPQEAAEVAGRIWLMLNDPT